jgi:hypothetical protein
MIIEIVSVSRFKSLTIFSSLSMNIIFFSSICFITNNPYDMISKIFKARPVLKFQIMIALLQQLANLSSVKLIIQLTSSVLLEED